MGGAPGDDNPAWTADDFARAKPPEEVLPPEVLANFGQAGRSVERERLKRLAGALGFSGRHAAETQDEAAIRRIGERKEAAEAILSLIADLEAQAARVKALEEGLANATASLRGCVLELGHLEEKNGVTALFEVKERARESLNRASALLHRGEDQP
jgi:hypothetical protein